MTFNAASTNTSVPDDLLVCLKQLACQVESFNTAAEDIFGYSAGDKARRSVAQVMRQDLRTQDFIARYGGEEIAVICETGDEDAALTVAERLRSSVSQINVPHRSNAEDSCVTISVGVAFG